MKETPNEEAHKMARLYRESALSAIAADKLGIDLETVEGFAFEFDLPRFRTLVTIYRAKGKVVRRATVDDEEVVGWEEGRTLREESRAFWEKFR